MKKINYKGRCEKRKVSKCKDICRTYSKIQSAFVEMLEKDDSVISFECNVRLTDVADGIYSTDIVAVKADGTKMIRECVWRINLLRPSYTKLLDISRNYWLSQGVEDWGIVSKMTPGLFAAEIEVPYNLEAEPCENSQLVDFVKYVLDVFHAPVDMETDVPVGSFLRSKLDEQYQSGSKMKVYSTKLYENYCSFFRDISEPMGFEGFQKVYNNYSLDHYRIYQLAYFQGISVEELAKRPAVPVNTAMEEFYRALASEYGIDFDTVSKIGYAVISKYRNLGKVARKSGPKQREWAELDEKYLPKVKEIVDRIFSSEKPDRVSITRVEREVGAPPKQFQKLPKCTKYVEDHVESMNEFRARKVTWAVRLFLEEGRYLSLNKLNHFLNFRKNDLSACFDLIKDPVVLRTINNLRAGMTFPQSEDGCKKN